MLDAIFWMVIGAMIVLGLLCCYSAWVAVRSELYDDDKRHRRKYRCIHKWQE